MDFFLKKFSRNATVIIQKFFLLFWWIIEQKYLILWMPYIIIIIKTIILCIWAIIIRGTLPRYRFDQLTYLTWKHFVFIWLAFLFLNASLLLIFF